MVDREFEDRELEEALREGLKPRNAPEGFAARVMGRIPEDGQAEHSPEPRRPELPRRGKRRRGGMFAFPARLAAVASVLLVVLAGTFAWQHQQQVAGERARRQVMTALRITHSTLEQVGQNVTSIQNRKDTKP